MQLTTSLSFFQKFKYSVRKEKTSGFMLYYVSEHDEDRPYRNNNQLYLQIFGHLVIFTLPAFVKPQFQEVDGTREYFARRYGFRYSGSNVVLYYGVQDDYDHKCVKEKRKSFFLPWKQCRTTKLQLRTMDDQVYYDHPVEPGNYHLFTAEEKKVPTVNYAVSDYDGMPMTMRCYVELNEIHRGRDGFEWVGFFYPKKVEKSLRIKFDKEAGTQKGSWKGGSYGASVMISDGETPLQALDRFLKNPSEHNRELGKITMVKQLNEEQHAATN